MGESEFKVFIACLNPAADELQLTDFIKTASEATSVTIFRDKRGRSKCCGIASFKTQEDIQCVMHKLHNTEFCGRRITFEVFQNPSASDRSDDESSSSHDRHHRKHHRHHHHHRHHRHHHHHKDNYDSDSEPRKRHHHHHHHHKHRHHHHRRSSQDQEL